MWNIRLGGGNNSSNWVNDNKIFYIKKLVIKVDPQNRVLIDVCKLCITGKVRALFGMGPGENEMKKMMDQEILVLPEVEPTCGKTKK